jgi:cell division transport system ATP-binding protein
MLAPPVTKRIARALVRFEDVSLRYGAGPQILRHISFHLRPGSFHFLAGPSGAGKSSLLKLLYLAQRPTHGRVRLFDRDVASLTRRETAHMRRRIGVVFQDFRLLGHLTALENVALPLKICGQRENMIHKHVSELLAWVGLAEQIHAYPPTLSGGQQQRVAIARAVVARPDLLLADEPTGNVDDRLAESLVSRFTHPVLRLADGEVRLAARVAPTEGSAA